MAKADRKGSTRKSGSTARRKTSKNPVVLRVAHAPEMRSYLQGILTQTHFLRFVALLVVLWMISAAGIYEAEKSIEASSISSYGRALYWGIAAFSTAGIADAPHSAAGRLVGGIWIIIGSAIFFGIIIATVTSYFMRPMQRPVNQVIDTIEYNLEHLEDLSMDELELLRETTDALIVHMERLKEARSREDA